MKVIGKTEYGWILEASTGEIEDLAGEYKRDLQGRRSRVVQGCNVRIGTTFDVHSMYKALTTLRENTTAKDVAERLRSLATLIEAEQKFITTLDPQPPEEPQEDQP